MFDSGNSWSIFSRGDGFLISTAPPAAGKETIWTAEADRSFSSVRITCNRRLLMESGGKELLSHVMQYPLDQILMMHILARHSGVIFHAAGAIVEGRGLAFPGVSGAGKSTAARLMIEDRNIDVLSDDRVVVRRLQSGWFVYGTPWPGDACVAKNTRSPLEGLLFLTQGEDVDFRPLAPRETLEKIIPVASIPWYDRVSVEKMLALCNDLIGSVPAFEMTFSRGTDLGQAVRSFVLREWGKAP